MTISKPNPRFGIVKLKKDRIIEFCEKSFKEQPWVNSGWLLMSKKVLNNFKKKTLNFESYIFNQSKNIFSYVVHNKQFYLPIDDQNDLKKANISWKNNKTLWL